MKTMASSALKTSRGMFRGKGLLILLGAALVAFGASEALPTAAAAPRILFIDDVDIASMQDVERIIHPGQKDANNPVLVGDRPWEANEVMLGAVRKEGDLYRMWYQSHAGGTFLNLYAESSDGITWTKPNLGQFRDFSGSFNNNIFFSRAGLRSGNLNPATVKSDIHLNVLYTPHMGPGRTYTMYNYDYGRAPGGPTVDGYYIAFSDDGITWTEPQLDPVIPGYADVGYFTYDKKDQMFRATVKSYEMVNGYSRRLVNWTESADGFNWTTPQKPFLPDAIDDNFGGGNPGENAQFYGMPIFRYESNVLGFLWLLWNTDGLGRDGHIDTQLASSRDGQNWQRVGDRRTIIERASEYGTWDWGIVKGGNSLIVDGDEVRMYYTAFNSRHKNNAIPPEGKKLKIGFVTWQRDRFVGLKAGSEGGEVVVDALISGQEMYINADASGGWLVAELLDQYGVPIAGFEAANSIPLSGDSLDHLVRWQGDPSLDPLIGQSVGIRLEFADAEVFSVYFVPEPATLSVLGIGGLLVLRRRRKVGSTEGCAAKRRVK